MPNVGVHVERNRAPEIVIDATRAILDHLLSPRGEREGNDDGIADDGDSPPPPRRRRCEDGIDSFFPVMGWTCGNLSDGVVPLILGFDLLEVTDDDLKAFCAAFGTTGSGKSASVSFAVETRRTTPSKLTTKNIHRQPHFFTWRT